MCDAAHVLLLARVEANARAVVTGLVAAGADVAEASGLIDSTLAEFDTNLAAAPDAEPDRLLRELGVA